jgi:phosphomannomutase
MSKQGSISISELMEQTGVQFGTSGVRGLADSLTDYVSYAYTAAFVQYLLASGELDSASRVAIAGDFRPSTPRIMVAVARAVKEQGLIPVNAGTIPTPAVAFYGMRQNIPSIMVTGSHIPDDRNGIKFNKSTGEILKEDEAGIRDQVITIPQGQFDDDGMFLSSQALPEEDSAPYQTYFERYQALFSRGCLQGRRIGLYEHSSVARQLLREILESLGAEVKLLGYSDRFVPVDTEAIRIEDIELAKEWSARYQLESIVSTDGDGDRPLVSDEHGNWLRGDVAGILCARFLNAGNVATPVSSNSAVEKCGWFQQVRRTRIGSPYVISAMNRLLQEGNKAVVGYEANGGFLTADRLTVDGRNLEPLPTRDAVIVILGILMLSRQHAVPVSGLLDLLPQRFTYSDRLKDFPTELSKSLIAGFCSGGKSAIESVFGEAFGGVEDTDETDGLRIFFESNEVVHLRPSGNAPELRCYNEAASPERAQKMNQICMEILGNLPTAR